MCVCVLARDRGVKDKLPGGRYVLMVSLYNRLSGHVLRWSKLRGQMWGGATLPVTHDGQFYNVEIKVCRASIGGALCNGEQLKVETFSIAVLIAAPFIVTLK